MSPVRRRFPFFSVRSDGVSLRRGNLDTPLNCQSKVTDFITAVAAVEKVRLSLRFVSSAKD